MGGSLVHRALIYGASREMPLSERSGLPLLTERVGTDFQRLYDDYRREIGNSEDVIDLVCEMDNSLFIYLGLRSFGALNRLFLECKDIGDCEQIGKFLVEMGNLGAETAYEALEKQNKIYL